MSKVNKSSKKADTNSVNPVHRVIAGGLVIGAVGTVALIAIFASSNFVSFSANLATTTENALKCREGHIQFGGTYGADCSSGNQNGSGSNAGLESLRNTSGTFSKYAGTNESGHNGLINTLTKSSSIPGKQANGHGQFRTSCKYSHLLYDDPLVYPGQSGASHLHMFFGNTAVNANTTQNTLVNSGGGSCGGQSLNRTSYWIPALIDQNDNVRVPEDVIIYYKATVTSKAVEPPQGLGIISGAPNNTDPSYDPTALASWGCGTRNASSVTQRGRKIPNCNNGDYLLGFVNFGECWNGQLRSSDNVSHVVKSIGKGNDTACPASHPKIIPKITYNVVWPHDGTTEQWRLSSDKPGAAGGTSFHGDWWGGWNNQVLDTWMNSCIKQQKNCAPDVLGNGRTLLTEANSRYYNGPYTLRLP